MTYHGNVQHVFEKMVKVAGGYAARRVEGPYTITVDPVLGDVGAKVRLVQWGALPETRPTIAIGEGVPMGTLTYVNMNVADVRDLYGGHYDWGKGIEVFTRDVL